MNSIVKNAFFRTFGLPYQITILGIPTIFALIDAFTNDKLFVILQKFAFFIAPTPVAGGSLKFIDKLPGIVFIFIIFFVLMFMLNLIKEVRNYEKLPIKADDVKAEDVNGPLITAIGYKRNRVICKTSINENGDAEEEYKLEVEITSDGIHSLHNVVFGDDKSKESDSTCYVTDKPFDKSVKAIKSQDPKDKSKVTHLIESSVPFSPNDKLSYYILTKAEQSFKMNMAELKEAIQKGDYQDQQTDELVEKSGHIVTVPEEHLSMCVYFPARFQPKPCSNNKYHMVFIGNSKNRSKREEERISSVLQMTKGIPQPYISLEVTNPVPTFRYTIVWIPPG